MSPSEGISPESAQLLWLCVRPWNRRTGRL